MGGFEEEGVLVVGEEMLVEGVGVLVEGAEVLARGVGESIMTYKDFLREQI